MKWQISQPAQIGQTRVVEKFAWLPTKCIGNINAIGVGTEYRVWLECYTSIQQYKRVLKQDFKDSGHGYIDEEWVEVESHIIERCYYG